MKAPITFVTICSLLVLTAAPAVQGNHTHSISISAQSVRDVVIYVDVNLHTTAATTIVLYSGGVPVDIEEVPGPGTYTLTMTVHGVEPQKTYTLKAQSVAARTSQYLLTSNTLTVTTPALQPAPPPFTCGSNTATGMTNCQADYTIAVSAYFAFATRAAMLQTSAATQQAATDAAQDPLNRIDDLIDTVREEVDDAGDRYVEIITRIVGDVIACQLDSECSAVGSVTCETQQDCATWGPTKDQVDELADCQTSPSCSAWGPTKQMLDQKVACESNSDCATWGGTYRTVVALIACESSPECGTAYPYVDLVVAIVQCEADLNCGNLGGLIRLVGDMAQNCVNGAHPCSILWDAGDDIVQIITDCIDGVGLCDLGILWEQIAEIQALVQQCLDGGGLCDTELVDNLLLTVFTLINGCTAGEGVCDTELVNGLVQTVLNLVNGCLNGDGLCDTTILAGLLAEVLGVVNDCLGGYGLCDTQLLTNLINQVIGSIPSVDEILDMLPDPALLQNLLLYILSLVEDVPGGDGTCVDVGRDPLCLPQFV